MKIFITGATGFLGANIARRLLSEGHEVHASIRRGANAWRLENVMRELNAHDLDICDYGALCREICKIKPEGIIHLATYGAYPTVQTEFEKIFQTNMIGTANLVRACSEVKYGCFINTSSSSEYGLVRGKMSESNVPAPVNYYGATKAGATIFCSTHTRLTGAPIITTRLFSAYGPYEEPMRLVPSTIKKCIGNEKLEFTDGGQKRDFIYTADIEDAYLELLFRPDLAGEVINIGKGTQQSVREMVCEIIKATGTSSKPQWGALPTRENETFNWVADVEKSNMLLKWRPKVSLPEGIERTVAWMRENIQHYKRSGD